MKGQSLGRWWEQRGAQVFAWEGSERGDSVTSKGLDPADEPSWPYGLMASTEGQGSGTGVTSCHLVTLGVAAALTQSQPHPAGVHRDWLSLGESWRSGNPGPDRVVGMPWHCL